MGDDESVIAWLPLLRVDRIPMKLRIDVLVAAIRKLERQQQNSSSRLRPVHSALVKTSPRKRTPRKPRKSS